MNLSRGVDWAKGKKKKEKTERRFREKEGRFGPSGPLRRNKFAILT